MTFEVPDGESPVAPATQDPNNTDQKKWRCRYCIWTRAPIDKFKWHPYFAWKHFPINNYGGVAFWRWIERCYIKNEYVDRWEYRLPGSHEQGYENPFHYTF